MKRNKNFTSNEPLLYLVATPIGNLKEFTPRAIEVISECDLVAAEDTQNTKKLLSAFNISKPLISLHQHNEKERSLSIIEKIKEGKKVVYVSDAGYPGISDPGNIIVQECIKNDINVSTICGSCAFINALVSSGLDTNHFYFYGFLQSKDSDAKKELEELKDRKETIILYEAPHRIKRTLNLLKDIFGERKLVLARELTKKNEEYIRGTTSELSNIDESTLLGEMVLIIEGNQTEKEENIEEIQELINLLKSKNLTSKDIVEIVSKTKNINKNKVYSLIK